MSGNGKTADNKQALIEFIAQKGVAKTTEIADWMLLLSEKEKSGSYHGWTCDNRYYDSIVGVGFVSGARILWDNVRKYLGIII